MSSSTFSLPILPIISFWKAQSFLIASCPNKIPSRISFSLHSAAPASTIQIASLVPATVKFIFDFSSCSTLGLIIYSLPILPTTTPETGPSKGISEIPKDKEEPNKAAIMGELS